MKESRFELKPLLAFVKREFREKRPNGIDLLLIKQRVILTRGVLPELQIRTYPGARHLVVEDFGAETRIYYFAPDGSLAGGVTVPSDTRGLQKIWRGSRSLFHLPKEKPAPRLEEEAGIEYQRFTKVYADVAAIWGAKRTPPPLIIVPEAAPVESGRQFGLVQVGEKISGNLRQLALKAIRGLHGPFLLAREAFRHLLIENGSISNSETVEDLATLLAAVYKGAAAEEALVATWQDAPLTPAHLAALREALGSSLPEATRPLLQAVAIGAKLLHAIGESVVGAAGPLFFECVVNAVLAKNPPTAETILGEFYSRLATSAEVTSKNATYLSIAKALLLQVIFGGKEVEGKDCHVDPLVVAVQGLIGQKYQALLNYVQQNETIIDQPLLGLVTRAFATQLRVGGVEIIPLPEMPLAVGSLTPFHIEVRNHTDLLLGNAEIKFHIQPSQRLELGIFELQGPIALHSSLKYSSTVLGKSRGKVSLEILFSFDHPFPGEKRITVLLHKTYTIE